MRITRVDTRARDESRGVQTRVYFWNVMDGRKTRYDETAISQYRTLLKKVLAELGYDKSGLTAKWHDNAGYKLPATPGFVVDAGLEDPNGNIIDIHVFVQYVN